MLDDKGVICNSTKMSLTG